MLVIALLVISTGLIAYYLFRPNNYWTRRGVSQKDAVPIFGHMAPLVFRQTSFTFLIDRLYNQFPEKRYSGVCQFNAPIFLIRDPDLVKQICVKDFDHFVDHRTFVPPDVEPLWGKNLINLKGDQWRNMRGKLSPAFTSSKMRQMFHLMSACGENFANYFEKNPTTCSSVDMKDVLTRYTNDMIGSVAFGVECDSLKNRNNQFYLMGKEANNLSGVGTAAIFFILLIQPKLAKLFNIRIFSKKVASFFTNLITETICLREKNKIKRADMLQLLMEARKENSEEIPKAISNSEESLTIEDITAQALIFFLGGFDTVSQIMNYLSYELIMHTDIQKKLQKEIDAVFKESNGLLTYEALTKMKYLDNVISEILRKYPPFIAIDRECAEPYTIEPKYPDEKPVHFNKGDLIWLPNYSIQHDEKYYPNPELFDPDRFSDENKSKIDPYTYFPFGTGPRSCIGNRFALLETKILFFHILRKFDLVANAKTPRPLTFQKGTFLLMPEKPIILTFASRSN